MQNNGVIILLGIYAISILINYFIEYREAPDQAGTVWSILYILLSPLTVIYTVSVALKTKETTAIQEKVSRVYDKETDTIYAGYSYEEYLEFLGQVYMEKLLTEPELQMTAGDFHSGEQWQPYIDKMAAAKEIILLEYPDLGCTIIKGNKN